MRYELSVTSVSWIPSESIPGFARLPVDLGVAHYNSRPRRLCRTRRLWSAPLARLANELRAWVEVDGGRITGHGYKGRGHINVTTVNLGAMKLAVPAVAFPDLRSEPEVGPDYVRFTQTKGGRTRLPAMLPSLRRPFVRVRFPVVWTTLARSEAVWGNMPRWFPTSPWPRRTRLRSWRRSCCHRGPGAGGRLVVQPVSEGGYIRHLRLPFGGTV